MNKVIIHKNITSALSQLYEKKNADYGDSFGRGFAEYGFLMPVIRLEDKLNRVKALTVQNRTQRVTDENIKDTLLDLANYAIMTVVEMEAVSHD